MDGAEPAGARGGGRPEAALQPLSRAGLVQGVRAAWSFPLLILCFAFVGFGAFARDAGLTLFETWAMGVLVWALPSQVVFVVALTNGASLVAAAVAVTLSAVRLLPMTVALIPLLRSERVWSGWLYLASHFIAVTGYVMARLSLPTLPPERRLSYFLGLGAGLLVTATSFSVAGWLAAGVLPGFVSAGLVFVTPIYFLLSFLSAASEPSERFALYAGLVLGPIAHRLDPAFDLLWAGLLGGSLAYAAARWRHARAA